MLPDSNSTYRSGEKELKNRAVTPVNNLENLHVKGDALRGSTLEGGPRPLGLGLADALRLLESLESRRVVEHPAALLIVIAVLHVANFHVDEGLALALPQKMRLNE